MSMRRSIIWGMVGAVVALAAAAGLAFALYTLQTPTSTVKLVPAKVSAEAAVATSTGSGSTGTQWSSLTVTNTGNIDAFVRVRVALNWVDGSGNLQGQPSSTPNPQVGGGWIAAGDGVYYLSAKLAPGSTSGNLLAAPLALQQRPDDFNNTIYEQVEASAEAIQALPAKAAEEAWGVSVNEAAGTLSL